MSARLLGAVGARIRSLREARGLSQEAFAGKAGIARAYLGKIERGRQNVSILTGARIAGTLGVTLSVMLEGVPELEPDEPTNAGGQEKTR